MAATKPSARDAAPAATAPNPLLVSRGDWVDLPIGFDPYWNPEEGKSFVARVSEFDARDPQFVRIRMQAVEPTQCQKGDTEHAEPVLVEPGGFFTISTYAGIARELMYHCQSGIRPEVLVTCVRKDKVKTGPNAGKEVWIFNAKVRPEDRAKLAAGREEYFRQLNAAKEVTRPQIPA